MKEISFEVSAHYPYIMLCVVVLCIYVLIMPYLVVIPRRNKIMNPRFMKQFFKAHSEALGPSANWGSLTAGYPDQGNGMFADKLPYLHWYHLNNTIRVHQNFVESMPQIIGLLLIGGLYFPRCTLAVGFLNCLTRPLYIFQYLVGGPNKRILGAVSGSLPLYLLGVATLGQMGYEMM